MGNDRHATELLSRTRKRGCARLRLTIPNLNAPLLKVSDHVSEFSRSIGHSVARCGQVGEEASRPTDHELENGIPLFLDQITHTLELEETASDTERLSGPTDPPKAPAPSEIGKSAAKHGNELRLQGFTVDQVVHDYGDLCQAVTELAVETNAPITAAEFRTLNRCLDNAIADAVMIFASHDSRLLATPAAAANESLAFSLTRSHLLDFPRLVLRYYKVARWLNGAMGRSSTAP